MLDIQVVSSFFTLLTTLPLHILVLISYVHFSRDSLGQFFKCFDCTHSKSAFYNVTQKK